MQHLATIPLRYAPFYQASLLDLCHLNLVSKAPNKETYFFFFLMIRPPPRSTLFPNPPLFRSQGTPIVTRCPLPAHPTALGDQLQVPVALVRRGLCRCAWHRARTWRHNDRRIRMTLADLTVDKIGRAHV